MNKKESFSQIFESLKKKSGYNDFAESGGISKNNTSSSESLTEKLFIRAQDIAYLRALSSVHYYRTLKSSNKKLSAPIIFIKRIIRKLGKFLIEPPLQDITVFNDASVNFLERLTFYAENMEAKFNELEAELQKAKSNNQNLEAKIKSIESKNKNIEANNKNLESKIQLMEKDNKLLENKCTQLAKEVESLNYYKNTVEYLNNVGNKP